MQEFRLRQNWVPWWIGYPLLAVYLVFFLSIVRFLDQPEEHARIFLPCYTLLGVLAIPFVINARLITVSVRGVTVKNGPLPMGKNFDFPRAEIRSCHLRISRTYDTSGGRRNFSEDYFAGVNTNSGYHDIAYPYLKRESAMNMVWAIADALNQGGTRPVIEVGAPVYEIPNQPGRKERVTKVLIWATAFIVAVLLGAYWDATYR
jgi:hypothetical protein